MGARPEIPKLVGGFEDWMWDAKCYGQDTRRWFNDRRLSDGEANRLCAGCPFEVMQKCAARGLHYKDVGVIVAGVALGSDRTVNDKPGGGYDQLRKIVAGVRPVFTESTVRVTIPPPPVANDPAEALPKRWETDSCMLDGFEYVSPGGASKIMGLSEKRFRAIATDLGLTKRYIRIHPTGCKSVFFLADEVRRAQEKRSVELPRQRAERFERNKRAAVRERGTGFLRRRAEKTLVESL